MPIDFYKQGPAIGDADIDAFEQRIGRPLPPDYRAFLLRTNGGRPKFHVIRDTEAGDVGVKIFFGIWNKEYFDVEEDNDAMRGRWPGRFISIAIDDGGNRFCLSLGPPDDGSVCYWHHEEEAEEDEEPTELNLYHVADSFADFWDRIEPIDRDVYLAEVDRRLEAEAESRRSQHPPPSDTNGEQS